MNNENHSSKEPRDEDLWILARKRAGFRRHLVVYVLINSFLWLSWAIMGGKLNGGIPWPAWTTLGWGLGLAFNYADAYLFHRENSVEDEYQKLIKKKQNQ